VRAYAVAVRTKYSPSILGRRFSQATPKSNASAFVPSLGDRARLACALAELDSLVAGQGRAMPTIASVGALI
jgi:hypothetical protein